MKARFKVGQVVVSSRPILGSEREEFLKIGWKEYHRRSNKNIWVYRTARWASIGYEEQWLRPLTKREAGR